MAPSQNDTTVDSNSTDSSTRNAERILTRFLLLYFTLYSLSNQIGGALIPIPGVDIPDLGTLGPAQFVVSWTAKHVFGVTSTLVFSGSGSGDKTYDWVLNFCVLVLALLGTALWTAFARRRAPGAKSVAEPWFRIFLRLALASQMIVYGITKLIPLQMPFPGLTRLIETYGDLSPMGVLWAAVGSSPAYEVFTGTAEFTAGILLLFPRTLMLGLVLCCLDLTEVFVLNMTYDVPVKLFSFNLLLLSAFLLARYFRGILRFLFGTAPVARVSEPTPFAKRRRPRLIVASLLALWGMAIVGASALFVKKDWTEYGPGRAKPALYGIWDVASMSVAGQTRPPLVGDTSRWRYLVCDYPNFATVGLMNNTVKRLKAKADPSKRTLELTDSEDKKWIAKLRYSRPVESKLTLEGDLSGQAVTVALDRRDLNKFLLVSRGFHWVQEYPFNR